MAEAVRDRQGPKRADGVDEERVRAVERVDEPAARDRRPPRGLDGAAHLQRQLVELALPLGRVDPAFARETPERAVGADVVESVVVHADMRQMRRHALDRPRAAEIEERAVAGGVELQQRGAELEALRPLGPAPGAVDAVHREHRRAVGRIPSRFERQDLRRRPFEDAPGFRQQVADGGRLVYADHSADLRGTCYSGRAGQPGQSRSIRSIGSTGRPGLADRRANRSTSGQPRSTGCPIDPIDLLDPAFPNWSS